MIQPDSEKEAPIALQQYADLLGQYLKPHWKKASLMGIFLLASILLQLVVPQVLRYFIDTATSGGAVALLYRAALIYLAAAVANQVFGAAATYLGADVGWTATNLMRKRLAAHCLSLDMSFHTSRNPGEMIERIDGDITALSNFFSSFSVRVFGGLLLLIGILTLLWIQVPVAGLMFTVFTVAVMLWLSKAREVAVPSTRKEREAVAQLYGFIEERLAGIEDIRANGGGSHAMSRFVLSMRGYYFDTRRAWLMRSLIWLSSYGFFILGDVATIGVAIYLVGRGDISVGTAYLVFQYMLMLRTPIEQITRQLQELQKVAASIGRIQDMFAIENRLPKGAELELPSGPLKVQFDDVSFAYEDKTTLKHVSFVLAPGRTLGLLGRTGSGKTTLIRLLFRLYDPGYGILRLNGSDLRDISEASLHRRVGLVTQEVQLFNATVRDNLTFFEMGISDERIGEVLTDLDLSTWLESLPNGLDTVLESGGGGLSAGEAQLLAFARVFLKNPGLVILDEPSSRLDPATERRLEQAVDKLLEGRTAIIIAHRLDTVERADEIMVLEEGRVIEHDSRSALAADSDSRFAKMLRAGRDDLSVGAENEMEVR